jgi:uncharacterized protein YbjT (DUF2867 family)
MRILVTGATGNIGRMVVDHLLAAGGCTVRALTVDPARARLPDGVEVARGYLRRPETLPAAIEGVDAMYLAPTPETTAEVVAMAGAAGVRRIVDLSGEHESWWGGVATAVEAGGVPWTHLCPWDFMENSLSWVRQIRETGQVREPHPTATGLPIAMDDVAAVAAVVLTQQGHEGKAYTITGPEALTRLDLLTRLSEALGRPLEFVQVGREEAISAAEPDMGGQAQWYVDTILAGSVGNTARPTGLTAQLLGRPATTFATWARANAGRFR